MGMRKWRRMHAARDEPSEMSHVDEKISADGIRDRPEPRKIPIAGIARAAGDDELRFVLFRKPRDRIQVDSVVVAPGGKIVAGPLHEERGILYAEIDLERIGMARRSLDVVGHYARPDLFQLQVNSRPQTPLHSA